MGLFNRRPPKDSDKERFLGAKLTEARYDSLQNLVIGEVSLNSDDSKVVTITFGEDRIVKLWVSEDRVIAATDSGKPVDFREFLYWINASDGLKSNLISNVKELGPEALPSIESLAPALYDSFLGYSNDYMIETLKWASANFDSYTSVDTQIFKLKRVTDAFANAGITITTIDDSLSSRKKEEETTDRLIGIAGVDHSTVILSFGKNRAYDASTPEESFILAAAEADSNLEDALELGNGFSVLALLETVKNLSDLHAIEITFATDSSTQLPDLTDGPLKPYERIFVPTELGAPLYELAEEVFAQSAWREAILDIAQDNEKLEHRITVIEDKLINELADESFVEFVELPGDVQASVRLLLNEREAHNEKRTAILKKIRENILVEEEALTTLIDEKLAAIALAVVRFDLIDLSTVENDFDIDEQELEFKFNDGVIQRDANGDPFIREIAEGEDFYELEDTVPSSDFFDQVSELQETDEDVDLEDHAFAFDEFYESLTWVEKAALGVRPTPAERDTLPPIFLEVAANLGIDPYSIGR